MKTGKSWAIGAICLLLIGCTALLLARFRQGHSLGQPGLRIAEVSLSDETGALAATNSIFLPEAVLDYESKLQPVQREELEWLPPDTTFGRRLYTAEDGFQVFVSGVLMGTDRTSIHKPEFCLPGQGFQIHSRSQRTIVIERPHRYLLPVTRLDALREVRLPGGEVSRQGAVYVYWFVSGTRLSNDHLERMWWLAVDLLRTGKLQRWAYIGCLGACRPGHEDQTYARLERLIQDLVPEFQSTAGPETGDAPPAPAAALKPSSEPLAGRDPAAMAALNSRTSAR
jgi:hypothetical protein